jgi:plasmid stability protein
MERNIQIRNVPEDLHRTLKARAASEGMSLTEYVLRELRRMAERPPRRELIERLSKTGRRSLEPSAAEVLRQERDNR